MKVIRIPPQSPNCSPHAERVVRTVKAECIERMILVGEKSLTRAVREFEEYYDGERNHQGVGNRLLEPTAHGWGALARRERLGGLLICCYGRSADRQDHLPVVEGDF